MTDATQLPDPTLPAELAERERRSAQIHEAQHALERRDAVRVRAGAGEVHVDVYEAAGTARGSVIFAPGLSAHALAYAGFQVALADRGWNLLAFDLRGHGRSSGRPGDFTAATILEDARAVTDLAEQRFGGPLAVMGTSLGGFFALMASNADDRYRCAISHWIFLPDMPVTRKDARIRPVALLLNRIAPGLRLGTRGIAEWDAVCDTPELRQRLFDDPLFTWRYTVRALASGMTYQPPVPLTTLRRPHLVVIGERDAMTPLEYTQRVFDRLEGDKELAVIPGAGHMGGLVEHREAVLDAVDTFLARHLERPG